MTRKKRISGPGAADFIAAQGGADHPGVDPDKGATEVAREAPLTDAKNLEPDLAIDTDAVARNKQRGTPRGRNG